MFSIRNEEKWIKKSLILLMMLFFTLNLFATLKYGAQNYLGDFEKFNNDDVKYIRSAWELAEKGHFIYHKTEEPTVFIMPGLTWTLAFFVKLFGRYGGITAFRVFQAILQGTSLYLIFLIGRKVFNGKAALLGCMLDVLYVPEYYASTIILTEVLFKFLLLLLLYLSLYAIEEKKPVYYTIGGIVWGLGCLVRPTVAAYPAVILVMWIFGKYSLKDMIKYTLITVLACSMVMSPWWIRNYQVFHRFIPLTLSSGNPFLQGTYVNYDHSKDETTYKMGKTMIETNENELRAGLNRLKTYGPKEPLRYLLWYTFGKSLRLWGLPFYWKELLGVRFAAAAVYHQMILLPGVFMSAGLLKRRNRGFSLLFGTAIFFGLVYLPYFAMSRYIFPIMPILCLITGYGIYEQLERRRGHWKYSEF